MSAILVADDDPGIVHALKLVLGEAGHKVAAVSSPKECLEHVAGGGTDAVLLDLNFQLDTTSGTEGLDVLAELRKLDDTLPIVVLTAWASIELAVEAMRAGAGDFLQKPWDNHRLISTLNTQLSLAQAQRQTEQLRSENHFLRQDFALGDDNNELIAESAPMKSLLATLDRLAMADLPILLTGENGTGKSALVSRIHQRSSRASSKLVSVNMGAIAESLFESEMFGHTRGAFTDAKDARAGRFELAKGGTLFLDEVANIPMSQQGKLLRVLESGEFERLGSSKTRRADVRLVSATNADLERAVVQGQFRQDLIYRLRGAEVVVPALRDRHSDILPLARRFLAEFAARYGNPVEGLNELARSALLAYDWPGNVRELRSLIERAVVMTTGRQIEVETLGLAAAGPTGAQKSGQLPSLAEIEREAILARIEHFGGNMTESARSLGLSRSSFYRRLDKHKGAS